jgi:hypothetical protein
MSDVTVPYEKLAEIWLRLIYLMCVLSALQHTWDEREMHTGFCWKT